MSMAISRLVYVSRFLQLCCAAGDFLSAPLDRAARYSGDRLSPISTVNTKLPVAGRATNIAERVIYLVTEKLTETNASKY